MTSYRTHSTLVIIATAALASLAASAFSAHAQRSSQSHPFGADFRTAAARGPATQRGYVDRHRGLLVRITRVVFGRITGDEGCSTPTPQYELRLSVVFRNITNHTQHFDVVGLHVIDQKGQTHRPYAWYQDPNSPSSLGLGQSKAVVLPYYVLRKQSDLSVAWRSDTHPYIDGGSMIARYRLTTSRLNACSS